MRTKQQTGNSSQLRAASPLAPVEASGLALTFQSLVLDGLRHVYPTVTGLLTGMMLVLGGIFPVVGRWLRDEIDIRSMQDVVRSLGGVWVPAQDPERFEDLGLPLTRNQAPQLFELLTTQARRLGTRLPERVYLTYLPCCGIVQAAHSKARAGLMIGLPLIDVLTLTELQAVLVHELAHLARGDTARTAWAIRFVEWMSDEIDPWPADPGLLQRMNPLRAWSRFTLRLGRRCLGPVVRGQESRADRLAASIVGGDAVASGLVKTAMVQPLFREILTTYEQHSHDFPNLYAMFRLFWGRLPEPLLTSMRHTMLARRNSLPDPAHPDILERIAAVQAYPTRRGNHLTAEPAVHCLGDVAALEAQLHTRLFKLDRPEPSIFHRAGS